MFKRWILTLVYLSLFTLIALLFISIKQSKEPRRDPVTLMNKYYKLRRINPIAAHKALDILLQQNQQDYSALKELSQDYFREKNWSEVLPLLMHLNQQFPQEQLYQYQLGIVYYQSGAWDDANSLFQTLVKQGSIRYRLQAEWALSKMKSSIPSFADHAIRTDLPTIKASSRQIVVTAKHPHKAIDYFYQARKHNPIAALQLIRKINQSHQEDVVALKEGGFLAMSQGCTREAIDYFTRAYRLTHDPNIALQLGYLYDQLNVKPTAYQYFQWASQNSDKSQALRAENAMTNLSGLQIKGLPEPYFTEVFFTPFSQSRFHLTVRPFLARFGLEQPNRYHTREYFLFRRTDDNQSNDLGKISQLYEDDVQIIGVGGQFTPFENLPITGFIETGAAYDLVYQNRDRWRGDLRAGFMYYDEFGQRPAYYDQLTLGHAYFGDLYGDATYFSRYNNNVIGGVRTHQGIRLVQYHSSIVNLYVTGRVIADTQRQFYNNFAEVGPGIAFIPTNRMNFQLRFEHLNGAYLPAGATPNPYNQYYLNNLVQLLFYAKI